MKFPLLAQIILSFATAAAMAWPRTFVGTDTLRAAGRNALGHGQLWTDHLVGAGYALGGWAGAGLGAALPTFVGLSIVMIALFAVARRLRSIVAVVGVGLVCLVFGVSGLVQGFASRAERIEDMRLLAPMELAEAAREHGGRVLVNPSAQADVASFAPELIQRDIEPSSLGQWMSNPVKWREADREKSASSILIAGQLTEARALVSHLLSAPDWNLNLVTNQGVLFLRGAGTPFSPPSPANFASRFSLPREKALGLSQMALVLQEVGLRTDARAYMDKAMAETPRSGDVLLRAASLAASQGRWSRALSFAEDALHHSAEASQGGYLLALSQLETGSAAKAFAATDGLLREQPLDVATWLLRARAARRLHDGAQETIALEHLLSIAQDAKVPTGRIHLFLGQAWAGRGFPEQAKTHYAAALLQGLTPAETRDVEEAIITIDRNRLPSE